MKKHFLLISYFLLSLTIGNAQTKKGCLDISMGPSFPAGQFSEKQLNDSKSGFAAMGQQVNISYLRKLNKKFGLSATLYAQRNPIDRDALASEFGKQNMTTIGAVWSTNLGYPPVTPGGPVSYNKNWVFEKHAWMAASLLLGGEGELPINSSGNFSFVSKAMVGITGVKSPKLEGRNTTDSSVAYVSQNSVSAFGFSYLVCVGVSYHLKKNVSLMIAANYFGTNNITFKKVKSTMAAASTGGNLGTSNAFQSVRTADAMQTIHSINISAGIRFHL